MLKRFVPYFRLLIPLKWPALAALASGIIASVMNGFGFPLIVKEVLPRVFPEDGGAVDQGQLLLAVLFVPVIFLVRGGFGFAHSYLTLYCGTQILEKIRMLVFDRLLALPLAFFNQTDSGDLYSRVMGDTAVIQTIVVNQASNIVRHPIQLIGAVGFVIYYCATTPNMFIFLAWISVIPILISPIVMIGRKVKRRSRQLQKQAAVLSSNLIEGLQAPREIRVFNLQSMIRQKFKSGIATLIHFKLKIAKYDSAVAPAIEVLSSIGICAALYHAGNTDISLDQLVPLLIALHMAYEPMRKIGDTYQSIKKAEASLERIEFILDQPDDMPDPAKPQSIAGFQGKLEFRDVSFSYNREALVLRNLNLEIGPGEIIALVGPSGAGKSTFTSLIPRLFDPTSGEILLDGHSLTAYAKDELRKLVSLVSQEPILFNDTIRNNIAISRPGASEEEIIAASKAAYSHDFITEFEKGYQTNVGERGGSLSGGQRQRVAIARAFLRNAPILILDESTSALDSESEINVQRALGELVKGKTVFIIAHRFSTTKVANRILVFEEGRIIADGPHEVVYTTCKKYRTLYDFQTTVEGS